MKIAGIGDNVMDRYMNMGVMFPGGNAVNVAAHASKLGADAAYVGSIGADKEGKILKEALESLHVDLSQCIFDPEATTKKCDVNVYDGERSYIGADEGRKWAHTTTIRDEDVEYLRSFDVMHTSCNAKLHGDIYKLKDLKGMVTFDFSVKDKYRTQEFLDMTCPYLELGQFSCDHMEEPEIREFLKKAYAHGCRNVLATMGSRGQIFYNGKEFITGKAYYVKPLDTMGAGDSYLAALLVELLKSGWKKGAVLERSVICGAMDVAANYSAQNCLQEGGFGFKNYIEGHGVA
ncbi:MULTISPECIES: PfkB family carbohydrate kinase [Clostridia]|uniref:PfkB family carbohydrate kinase n=1 Tax=Clostridia TaxID=186801 RepID=UPI00067F1B62|nr:MULTISPECIES: PfkB family carbohydrate kinase [Clostridia]